MYFTQQNFNFLLIFFLDRWASPLLPALRAQPGLCAVPLLQEAIPGVSRREAHPLLQGTERQAGTQPSISQGQAEPQQENAGTIKN